jgi:hypothetical protein
MKSRNTRKINRKNRSLKGGQSPPPAYANANSAVIQAKLTDFHQEANTLASWASQYQAKTNEINNTTLMDDHRRLANSLVGQANIMYNRAQVLWRTVYGSPWVPPSPAPAPSSV